MKVLLINGSPRETGNTMTILNSMRDTFICRSCCNVLTIHLNQLEMKGCQGCMACKNKTDWCIINDDMTPVYDMIQESDVVILGSPVYLLDVSGQFKLFLDRMFAFWDRSYTARILPGKTAVLVMPLGQNNLALGQGIADRVTPLLQGFGFSEVVELIFPGLNSRSAIKARSDYLELAKRTAERLARNHEAPTGDSDPVAISHNP